MKMFIARFITVSLIVVLFSTGGICSAQTNEGSGIAANPVSRGYMVQKGDQTGFGLGIGVIAKGSPYRDVNKGIIRVIPSISYIGEKARLYGPFFEYRITSYGRSASAALTARYRFGSYDVEDSRYFGGLESPEDTVMAGVGGQIRMPRSYALLMRCEFDALDRIGGFEARLHVRKRIRWKFLMITPEVGLNVMSSAMANHDYGVPREAALDWRPYYGLNNGVIWDANISVMSMPVDGWTFGIGTGVDFFGKNIRESPLVDKDYIGKGMLIVSRMM